MKRNARGENSDTFWGTLLVFQKSFETEMIILLSKCLYFETKRLRQEKNNRT